MEITESDRYSLWSENQFYTLEISKTYLEDSGKYSATVKNELGSISCHCTLIVDKGIRAYIAPEFYNDLDPIYTFVEGEELRLSARVEAYPSVGESQLKSGLFMTIL